MLHFGDKEQSLKKFKYNINGQSVVEKDLGLHVRKGTATVYESWSIMAISIY